MELERRETMLVVLGAGASRDCIPSEPGGVGGALRSGIRSPQVQSFGLPALPFDQVVPPLTQDLAWPSPLQNWVLDRWPLARPVIDHLRRHLPGSGPVSDTAEVLTLEQALADYVRSAESIPEREHHVLAARFYLRDLLWACTNYMMSSDISGGITNQLTLLNLLLEWTAGGDRCVVIISFNYDLLLERAMESTWDFKPTKLSSYLAHDRIHLLKPHGSIQWAWPLVGDHGRFHADPLLHGRISATRAVGHEEDRAGITTVSTATFEGTPASDYQPLIPALALPITGKADFCWPDDQASRVATLQGSVTRLLTIGWRGIESHFVPLLRPIVTERARSLVVAGGNDGDREAEETSARLQEQTDARSWATYGGGFSSLLTTDLDRLDWLLD